MSQLANTVPASPAGWGVCKAVVSVAITTTMDILVSTLLPFILQKWQGFS